MKLLLLSDLHNEFFHGTFPKVDNPGVDVLIIAGDILTAAHGPLEFLNHVSEKFPHVLYVMGNHEHYHGNIDTTRKLLHEYIRLGNGGGPLKNVHLLENTVWAHPKSKEPIRFIGTSLWTDINKENPTSEYIVSKNLNDYRAITKNDPEKSSGFRKLRTEDTIAIHQTAKAELKRTLDLMREACSNYKTYPIKVVIITHHGPSYLSIGDKYKHDTHMNGAYVSDLSQLILDYPEIKLWCHGHVHDSFDYNIGSTRVLTNPRGYPEKIIKGIPTQDVFDKMVWENSKFNPNMIIEV